MFVCVCFLVWAIMSRMLFVYVFFVCFFCHLYTRTVHSRFCSIMCLSFYVRFEEQDWNLFCTICLSIDSSFVFRSGVFPFFLFVYLHCTSCYSVMARIYKQETSNYQSIYCSFLFLFSRSMPSRHSTTVTTTQVSKKVCDRRAFKVLRYHYY
jgi:hypothetical protein